MHYESEIVPWVLYQVDNSPILILIRSHLFTFIFFASCVFTVGRVEAGENDSVDMRWRGKNIPVVSKCIGNAGGGICLTTATWRHGIRYPIFGLLRGLLGAITLLVSFNRSFDGRIAVGVDPQEAS